MPGIYLAFFLGTMKKVIGITGGIGSGKSTVSDFFESKNFIVLRADNIAKDVMLKNKKVKQQIVKEFVNESYLEDKLNTKYIAEKVFNNPDYLKKLNEIVHPPTISKINFDIQKLKRKYDIIFVEAAILFEANWEKYFDYILLVTADEDKRIKRLLGRNNITVQEIKNRILNQMDENKKKRKSDFIIENNADLDSLYQKADFFLTLFNNLP